MTRTHLSWILRLYILQFLLLIYLHLNLLISCFFNSYNLVGGIYPVIDKPRWFYPIYFSFVYRRRQLQQHAVWISRRWSTAQNIRNDISNVTRQKKWALRSNPVSKQHVTTCVTSCATVIYRNWKRWEINPQERVEFFLRHHTSSVHPASWLVPTSQRYGVRLTDHRIVVMVQILLWMRVTMPHFPHTWWRCTQVTLVTILP